MPAPAASRVTAHLGIEPTCRSRAPQRRHSPAWQAHNRGASWKINNCRPSFVNCAGSNSSPIQRGRTHSSLKRKRKTLLADAQSVTTSTDVAPISQPPIHHDPVRNGGVIAPRPRCLTCNERYLGDACSCCVAGDGAPWLRTTSPHPLLVDEAMAEPVTRSLAYDPIRIEETEGALHRCFTPAECHLGDRYYSCCVAGDGASVEPTIRKRANHQRTTQRKGRAKWERSLLAQTEGDAGDERDEGDRRAGLGADSMSTARHRTRNVSAAPPRSYGTLSSMAPRNRQSSGDAEPKRVRSGKRQHSGSRDDDAQVTTCMSSTAQPAENHLPAPRSDQRVSGPATTMRPVVAGPGHTALPECTGPSSHSDTVHHRQLSRSRSRRSCLSNALLYSTQCQCKVWPLRSGLQRSSACQQRRCTRRDTRWRLVGRATRTKRYATQHSLCARHTTSSGPW